MGMEHGRNPHPSPTYLTLTRTLPGKSSLDEALKELGIKSMGHRMKIINAMIVQ